MECPEHGNTLTRNNGQVECCIKDCPWQRLVDAGMSQFAAAIQQGAPPPYAIIPHHQDAP